MLAYKKSHFKVGFFIGIKMSCSAVQMPITIVNAAGADLLKDLKGIPDLTCLTTAPSGVTYDVLGDNSNIYTLLLTAGNISPPTVNTTASGASSTYTPSITAAQILTAFAKSSTATSDDEIKSLLTSYGFSPLTDITGQTEATLTSSINGFKNKVNFTYCAYEKMYKKALTEFFDAPTDAEKRKRAIILNLKLSIIIAGLDRIRVYLQDKTPSAMATSNANNEIAATTTNLSSQLDALTSKDSDRALYKRMVEYTEEKNEAHRNLLGLYSVLNLVALGVLFYIARN